MINHPDFIQFQKDIKKIYQQEYGDNGFELGKMFREPENPTEILGWIPINNGCYGKIHLSFLSYLINIVQLIPI